MAEWDYGRAPGLFFQTGHCRPKYLEPSAGGLKSKGLLLVRLQGVAYRSQSSGKVGVEPKGGGAIHVNVGSAHAQGMLVEFR